MVPVFANFFVNHFNRTQFCFDTIVFVGQDILVNNFSTPKNEMSKVNISSSLIESIDMFFSGKDHLSSRCRFYTSKHILVNFVELKRR